MKSYFTHFKAYHAQYLNLWQYILIGIYIGILIAINYGIDLEDTHIDGIKPAFFRIPFFFAAHALAYLGVLGFLKWFKPKEITLSKRFWLYFIIGHLILSIDRSIYQHIANVVLDDTIAVVRTYAFKTLNNAYGWLTVCTPLAIWYWLWDKKSKSYYGLRKTGIGWPFYLLVGAAIVVITFIAAQSSDFTSFYPVYKRAGGAQLAQYLEWPEWILALNFEFFYLTDFLNTELLFRGFFVIAMTTFLGRNAILPMAASYAVLHFGKPLGETVSSVLGGYILGVLALYTRNIWGGVFAHLLMAMCMEIFAYWLG
jgi:hypothetical protein